MAKPTDRDSHYFRAKRDGYVARSVYKLVEIDERFGVLKTGGAVLDLGASPGSWATYASQRVGAKGRVVAVDLNPIRARLPVNVTAIERDVATIADDDLVAWGAPFNAVLSDLAPQTSGVRFADQARSLDLATIAAGLAQRSLAPNGNFVVKLFQSAEGAGLAADLKRCFAQVKWVKPGASRTMSWELFLVATGFRAPVTSSRKE